MREELEKLLAEGLPADLNPTQERISRAALELFSESGYDATTTQAIAQRAGVTEKTLFRHFSNKRQLFAQVVYPAMVAFCKPVVFQGMQRIMAEERPTFPALLRALMTERVEWTRQHPEVLKLLTQELLLRDEFRAPFIRFWKSQVLERALHLFGQAKASGQLKDLPEATMLRAMISLTVGYTLTRNLLAPELEWHDESEVEAMLTILLQGITAAPSAAPD